VGEQYLATNRLTILVVGDRERIEQPLRDLGHPLTALDAEGAAVE
jgi:hypothetical protein